MMILPHQPCVQLHEIKWIHTKTNFNLKIYFRRDCHLSEPVLCIGP